MAARKKSPVERNELLARIYDWRMSYSISDYRLVRPRIDDEALMDLTGRIESIGPKHAGLIASPIHIALGCSMSYGADGPLQAGGAPSLFSLTFRKDHCS